MGRLLVAILDSGIFAGHPHLSGIPCRGFGLEGGAAPLRKTDDFSDVAGHGTACAAAVCWLQPRVEILAVRVLGADLRTDSATLAEGIDLAVAEGARLVNLSLGSQAEAARGSLSAAVARATERGAICVAAAHPRGEPLWPADLPAVLSAVVDPGAVPGEIRAVPGPLPRYAVCGWPRPIDGRPPRGNLFGTSLASAHLCARVATLLIERPGIDFGGIVRALDEATPSGRWRSAAASSRTRAR